MPEKNRRRAYSAEAAAKAGSGFDPLAKAERTLKGKVVVSGECTARALVAHEPISFLGMVNTETGTFDCPGHELEGQSLAGKVLVYPHGKGSSGDTIRMWRLQKFGVAPAGILMDRAEPIHVQGAMLLGVPTLCGFASDISKIIQTGDTVAIKGDTVTITRRPRDPRSK
jgi:hypothetical protein